MKKSYYDHFLLKDVKLSTWISALDFLWSKERKRILYFLENGWFVCWLGMWYFPPSRDYPQIHCCAQNQKLCTDMSNGVDNVKREKCFLINLTSIITYDN